ncbi:carbon storage regulator CsrA [bacterium]|nr:carbon storage regulator CsrA [bacterium]
MLVLTRKIGETITIDDNIKITVVQIKGKQVRVGIDAPKETKIYREEVYTAIQEENRAALNSMSGDLEKLRTNKVKKTGT